MELLDEPQRLEDLPEEFRINRFSFRFDLGQEAFAVNQERASNAIPLIAVLLFGALTGIFMIVGIGAFQAEGFEATAMVMLGFTLLGFLLTVVAVYKMRFEERRFAFYRDELLITSRLRSLRYARDDFDGVKVQTTIMRDYQNREISYRVDVVLLFSPKVKKLGIRELEIFQLEGKGTAKALLGALDRAEMEEVQREGTRIAKLLEIFWDLPLRS